VEFQSSQILATNRDATLSVTAPDLRGKLVTLPVNGVYKVKELDGQTSVRGGSAYCYAIDRNRVLSGSTVSSPNSIGLAYS
jgi:hypothetical protein